MIFFLVLPLVYGETFKQYEDMKISHEIRIGGATSDSLLCNITLRDPDQITLVLFQLMINNLTTQEHEYTLSGSSVTKTGEYCYGITCIDGGLNETKSFCNSVTPTGRVQTSILENPILLVFVFFALFLVGFGVYFKSPWFGFIGSVMFILGGVYTMIYGFNNVTDFYTRGLAIVFLGLGFIFMFAAAYEWWLGDED